MDIGLRRRESDGTEKVFVVSLIRGKKATFKDDEHFLLPEPTKAVSIMVPPSAKPGDILEACDEEGNRSKVPLPLIRTHPAAPLRALAVGRQHGGARERERGGGCRVWGRACAQCARQAE